MQSVIRCRALRRRGWLAAAHARRFAGACAALAGGTAAACGPCDGVVACHESPRLSISGQIVDRGNPTDADRNQQSGAGVPDAKPAAGVRVEVIPTAGQPIGLTSAVATTDGAGRWHVEMPAQAEGGVTVDVVVGSANGAGYRARDLHLLVSGTRGQGNVLGRWTRELFLTQIGEVIDATRGSGIDGARVTAVRRSGIGIDTTVNTRIPMVTYGGGLFFYDVRPLADGPLVLDFVIERDGRPPARVDSVTVYPQHEWLPSTIAGGLVFRFDSAGHRITQ